NVNATLIFSPQQAILCAKALNEGIKSSNKDVKAVVSVFVSRFDKMCDALFESKHIPTSRLGIINATKCYHEVNTFKNKNIRTLFASTATKSAHLEPSYYVDNLIFPNSINTAPLLTIEHWVKDGSKVKSKMLSLDECNEFFELLALKNININQIYDDLLNEGLESFKSSFKDLLTKLVS
ncbi:MAG: transaldolase family protein, partial [Arcobacteraceae bacterium]